MAGGRQGFTGVGAALASALVKWPEIVGPPDDIQFYARGITFTIAREGSLTYHLLNDRELQQIWILAHRPFTLEQWYPLWQEWAWPYRPTEDDEFGFAFELVEGLFGVAGRQKAGRFPLCMFRFCLWEGWDIADHADQAEHTAERLRFDAIFQIHHARAQSLYGQPQHTLIDTTDPLISLRSTIWQTSMGLCILQQSAIDVQFGYELHFWLEPFTDATFNPPLSLEQWLEQRHRLADGAIETGDSHEKLFCG